MREVQREENKTPTQAPTHDEPDTGREEQVEMETNEGAKREKQHLA